MDRIGQLVVALPRTVMAPVMLGVALAVLVVLVPTIFCRDREPFNRLMEFLELVLDRSRPTGRSNATVLTATLTAERREGVAQTGSTGQSF